MYMDMSPILYDHLALIQLPHSKVLCCGLYKCTRLERTVKIKLSYCPYHELSHTYSCVWTYAF